MSFFYKKGWKQRLQNQLPMIVSTTLRDFHYFDANSFKDSFLGCQKTQDKIREVKWIVTRRLSFLNVLTNISGSRWIPIQQPFTKIFVAWGITAGEISYIVEKKGKLHKPYTERNKLLLLWRKSQAPQNFLCPILLKTPE